jgi:sporulation protein YlmC with PRC-barrel domain
MTKKLLLGAALSALTLSGTLAQSPTTPNPGNGNPPQIVTPAKPGPSKTGTAGKSSTTTKTDTTKSASTQAKNGSSKLHIVASQKPDQWLASKFKGTEVVGSDNKKLGAISDILFDRSGKIEAYVVGFGGFLGMGAKEVAIAPDSFQVVSSNKGELKLAMNNKDLQRMPKFAAYQPPKPVATTSGAGRMGGGLSHGSPLVPSGR